MSDASPGRCIVCKKPLSINAGLAASNPLAAILLFCMTPGCCREGLVTMVRDDDAPAPEPCRHSTCTGMHNRDGTHKETVDLSAPISEPTPP